MFARAFLGLQPWMTLTRIQRRRVWEQFIYPLLSRWPWLVGKFVLVFLVAMDVVWREPLRGWKQNVAIFLVILLGNDVLDLAFLALWRRRVAEYIRQHETQIRSTA
jgi:hypothetical protein